MLDTISNFTAEAAKAKSRAAALPLPAARHAYIKPIYKLTMKLFELFVHYRNYPEVYNEIEMSFRLQFESIYAELIQKMVTIRNAETKEAAAAEFNDCQSRLVILLSGLIHADRRFSYRFSNHDFNYGVVDSKIVTETFAKAVGMLSAPWRNLNVFTTFGNTFPCRGSNNFLYSYMGEVVRSQGAFPKNVDADYYIYSADSVGYNILGQSEYKPFYKKLITGNSSEVSISAKFDMSIMATDSLEDYYSPYKEEVPKEFRDRYLFLNRHTSIGGIELFGMPRIFLNEQVIDMLSGYLDNLHIVSVSPESNFVVVVGNRRPFNIRNVNTICDIMLENLVGQVSSFTWNFANTHTDEILFRSAYPLVNEVEDAISANRINIEKLNADVLEDMAIKTDEETRHPLLPFSSGQLGLVLVSGKIDGVVDEGNNFYHVIKGSTVKNPYTNTSFNEDGDQVVTTTYATSTSVVMLTGDGEFKTLV